MNVKAVIWDLGGVLVRTDDLSSRERLAQGLGTTRIALEELVFTSDSGQQTQLGKQALQQHWENVRRALNLSSDELQQFQHEFWAGDRLDIQLVDLIRNLRPEFRTGLISNHFPDLRSNLREVWKIEDAFDTIVISCEVGLLKPDPQIYWLALQQLQVSPDQAIFIDDFSRNLAGAEAVGMHTIQFRSTDQISAELRCMVSGDS